MHAPLSPAFRSEWCSVAALESIAEEWRALAARALEPNVFYEPAFALAAAPVFGADAGAVLVRTAGGRLAGLFPARIDRWRGGFTSTLVGWTHPYAPLGTPLIDRDEPESVIAAWLDHLGRDPAMPAQLLLPLVPEQGAFAAALDRVLARQGRRAAAFGRHERALLAPGAERTKYLERAVSGRKRKKLRRLRRRLEDIAPVTVATATGAADVGVALKDFVVVEASGWKGRAGTAIVNNPAIRDFVQKAVAGLAAEGRARIERLLLNDTTIAAAVTLASGDTAWCWKIAYNEGLARSSPGVQLVCKLTENLLAQPTPLRVDSCATPDHPMIDHVWRERLALSDRLIALRRSAMPFALTCWIETLRRSAIAATKALRDRIRGR
jgi:CelD/BcsL family acetyltransferase involved in cellulose biosynthesis